MGWLEVSKRRLAMASGGAKRRIGLQKRAKKWLREGRNPEKWAKEEITQVGGASKKKYLREEVPQRSGGSVKR